MSSEIIVSIPHSGTRFLLERLKIENYIHTTGSWDDLLRAVDGKDIIAPLRRPLYVWRSMTRRWRNPNPFDHHLFLRPWYMMHALTLVREVDFIEIDSRKDSRITDWTPIGDNDAGDIEIPMIDLIPLYQLPFVKRFY